MSFAHIPNPTSIECSAITRRFYRIAKRARNKGNHIPARRSSQDCPERVKVLEELAEKRKKKQLLQSGGFAEIPDLANRC